MFFSHAMEEEERMRQYTIGRHFDRQDASNPGKRSNSSYICFYKQSKELYDIFYPAVNDFLKCDAFNTINSL